MWNKLILAGLAACLLSTSALAQDWRRYPPPVPRYQGQYYPRDYRRQYDPRDFPRYDRSYQYRDDYRHAFVYSANGGGAFEDLGGGMWVENTRNGQFRFREVRRTPEFIEMVDPDRGDRVRLYDTTSFHITSGTSGEWWPLYNGHWE
jgi:hypothetical protein